MRIAIASSGLGRIVRGIETWARDVAVALGEHGVDVTLFAGGPVSGFSSRQAGDRELPLVVLPSLDRNSPGVRKLIARTPRWAWRWGLRSTYGWEQALFWRRLWRELKKGRFDILHVQDPMLAYWCRRFRKLGLVATKEILAHGTEEPMTFLRQFEHLQHLAPWHLSNAECGEGRKHWVVIPNFVDTEVFRPADETKSLTDETVADRVGYRSVSTAVYDFRNELGVSEDCPVMGCVAAVKKHHKRIDYLIREFSTYLKKRETGPDDAAAAYLLIAGARQNDSKELVALADKLAPGRVKFLFDLQRSKMPVFYWMIDVFILTSLFEMMPIAVIEALASGTPVIANRHPVLEWMVETGGACIDMSQEGELAGYLKGLTPEWIDDRGRNARSRAVRSFSKETVVSRMLSYYGEVL